MTANAFGQGELVKISHVHRGVIYGHVEPEFFGDTSRTLEFFINGILIGSTTVSPSSADPGASSVKFKFLIPQTLIFEAPISVRVREGETKEEIGLPLNFLDSAEVSAAINAADGIISSVEAGSVKGQLYDVNSDALPIVIGLYHREEIIERAVVNSPSAVSTANTVIPSLEFSLRLPASVLDGTSSTVSVRFEGGSREFFGSPLTIRLDADESLHDRLRYLEDANEELKVEVARLREAVVRDIADQFYRFIIPRVDAIVTIQRESLEGQMTALWRELSDKSPEPIRRRRLPEGKVIRFDGPFTGYRWSHPIDGCPSERWFALSAFLASEISDKNDLLIVMKGSHAVSREALDGLRLTVNGRRVDLLVRREARGMWIALGVLPRHLICESGNVALLFETDVAASHPLAPLGMETVSISVGTVEMTPLKTAMLEYPISLRSDIFPFGWHQLELAHGVQPFRWMDREAIVVLNGLKPGAPVRLEVSGPCTLFEEALSSVTADLDGVPAKISQAGSGGNWVLKLDFPERPEGAPPIALLLLRARAELPGSEDTRHLSIGVSQLRIEPARDDDSKPSMTIEEFLAAK